LSSWPEYWFCVVAYDSPGWWWWWWACGWGETTSLNCGHQQAYCSSLRWYMSMENHSGMMMWTEENSWLFHQRSLAILPADI
jgi:hypothetical protein